MSRKKVTKEGLLVRMELMGYNKPDAIKALDTLSSIISEELCAGNSISIPKVGVLTGTPAKGITKKVAGIDRNIPERLSVKFSMSKVLKDYFNEKFSASAKQKEKIKGLGSSFLDKLK